MAKIEALEKVKSVNIDFPFAQPGDYRADGTLATSFVTIKEMIDRAVTLGFNTISFDTNVPINAQTGELLLFVQDDNNGNKAFSEEVWKGIAYAESIGLRTIIDLNIRNALNDIQIMTGNVGPNFSATKFFESVKTFETAIATRAQEYGVDGITIGQYQFGFASTSFLPSWIDLISSIRSVYKGTLRYSSNLEDTDNPLWALVDQIEVSLGSIWMLEPDFTKEDFLSLYFEPYFYNDKSKSSASTDALLRELISKYPSKSISVEIRLDPGLSAGHEFENPWGYVFTEDPLLANANDQSNLRRYPDEWIDLTLNQQKIAGFLEYFGNFLENDLSGIQVWQYAPWTESDWIRNPTGLQGEVWQSVVRAGSALNWNRPAEEIIATYFTRGWGFNTLHYGTVGDDRLIGSEVDEKFFASLGKDFIDGGAGLDIVSFSGKRLDYSLALSNAVFTVQDLRKAPGSQGASTLANIERLVFSDIGLAFDVSGSAGESYRIYKAAFNRTPDPEGLGYWIAQMDSGMDLIEVSARFIDSQEFRAQYGSVPSDADFLTKVYTNVLGRAPDKEGYEWWLKAMSTDPSKTKAKVLADFSESPENKVGTADLVLVGIEYVPWGG